MVNHIYDEETDATLCGEYEGILAWECSARIFLRGDDTIPSIISCNECITENGVRFIESVSQRGEPPAPQDEVHQPQHYTSHPSGVECIQITEHMNFLLGNAIKYIWRADLKGKAIQDLHKSIYYIEREIARREKSSDTT